MNAHEREFETVYANRNPLYQFLTQRFLTTIGDIVSQLPIGDTPILDVGCGEGFVIRHLQHRYQSIDFVALDIDSKRLSLTKRLSPDVLATEGNVYHLPVAANACNVVLANEILEHLDDPNPALAEIRRVSNLYVVCSAPNEPFFRIGNLLRGAYWYRLGKTPAHVNFWSRGAFVELLTRYFDVQDVRSCFPWTIALCRVRCH